MTKKVTPVILAGGGGTRLWPLSRNLYPKQFFKFDESLSLFQLAVKRGIFIVSSLGMKKKIIVVTNEDYRFIAVDQLKEFPDIQYDLFLEPIKKNTAPSLTLASLHMVQAYSDNLLLALPSDQVIENNLSFTNSVELAIDNYKNNEIVLFGVKPTSPSTSYGYMQLEDTKNKKYLNIESFIEKPTLLNAKKLIKKEIIRWNSGIFLLDPTVWIESIKILDKNIYTNVADSYYNKIVDGHFIRPSKFYFNSIKSNSIDYAVIEKQQTCSIFSLRAVNIECGWSDLGTWYAIWNYTKKIDKNAHFGLVESYNSKNNLVHSKHKLTVISGVDNLLVVDTDDALLVTKNNDKNDIKFITEQLDKKKYDLVNNHKKVLRPWGYYTVIEEGLKYKVKRIYLNPQSSISLQVHKLRAEHWVVVNGEAEVTKNNNILTLNENESIFIPLGTIHRLSNTKEKPLEIIEIQTGDTLNESDIERFDDDYGRDKH